VIVVIVALHLLQKEKERYASEEAGFIAAIPIVGLALAAGGYTLYYVSFKWPPGWLGDLLYVLGTPGWLGGVLYLFGLLIAALGLIGLAIITLAVGELPRWGGVALITGNPLWAVLPTIIYADTPYFSIVIWLLAGSWIVVGCAVFLAAGRRTEQPSRVR